MSEKGKRISHFPVLINCKQLDIKARSHFDKMVGPANSLCRRSIRKKLAVVTFGIEFITELSSVIHVKIIKLNQT